VRNERLTKEEGKDEGKLLLNLRVVQCCVGATPEQRRKRKNDCGSRGPESLLMRGCIVAP
jgi:hypothetical protein